MIWVLLAMLVILAVAGVVVAYVAFTRRGASVPRAAWLGPLLQEAVDRLPTLDNRRAAR